MLDQPPAARCVLDRRQPGRTVDGPRSLVCKAHREQLAELLDPQQRGQTFTKPDERRVLPSIPVLYALLPIERGRGGQQLVRSVPQSRPPGDLTAMAHRDPRSVVDDTDPAAPLSALGTLAAIALRLDLRDIHGQRVPLPRVDQPPRLPLRPPPQRDPHVCTICEPGQPHRNQWPQVHPVRDLCAWLHDRLDHLCAADWVDAAYDDLRRLHAQLAQPTGEAPPRPLGPCQKLVDTHGKPWQHEPVVGLRDDGPYECGVPLYLPGQALKGMDEPVALPEMLRCSGCRQTYTRAEYKRIGFKRGIEVPA